MGDWVNQYMGVKVLVTHFFVFIASLYSIAIADKYDHYSCVAKKDAEATGMRAPELVCSARSIDQREIGYGHPSDGVDQSLLLK